MRDDSIGIEGIETIAAEALIAALIAALAGRIVKPHFIHRHQWQAGDVLMWDNCLVQHRAIQDYDLPRQRLMHCTTIDGTVPA
jgi:alpha-ketoglutarate-dependent taurine dioxygenase